MILVVTNSDDYLSVLTPSDSKPIKSGDPLIEIIPYKDSVRRAN